MSHALGREELDASGGSLVPEGHAGREGDWRRVYGSPAPDVTMGECEEYFCRAVMLKLDHRREPYTSRRKRCVRVDPVHPLTGSAGSPTQKCISNPFIDTRAARYLYIATATMFSPVRLPLVSSYDITIPSASTTAAKPHSISPSFRPSS